MATKDEEHVAEDSGVDPELSRRLLATLSRVTGSDLSDFRETTLRRRIVRRMGLLGIGSDEEYVKLLERDDGEVRALFHDVFINVTGFFREPESFETLKAMAFPEMVQQDPPDGIRLWVPGCSTGEEPYSLAIALSEFLEEAGVQRSVQILATDINEAQIVRARAGSYRAKIASAVSDDRLERYFDKTPDGWRIGKRIREMCVFARHDLTRDPPFTRIDMVSCRNLLIYWNRSRQGRIIPLLHYALRPSGFLLLGSSESAARFPELFDPVDHANKLYRRRDDVTTPRVSFGPYGADRLNAMSWGSSAEQTNEAIAEAGRVVAKENPSGAALVDERLGSVYFWGETAPYFVPYAGEASLSVARFVTHELLSEAMSALEEARGRTLSAWRGPVALKSGKRVVLHVVPILRDDRAPYFLLLIDEQKQGAGESAHGSISQGVERELDAARQLLVAKVEELTVTNEELRTAEEQLRDANVELQGANRSQEERNVALQRLNDDLANVLGSVNLPLVVLDGEQRIRMFTSAAEDLLGIRADDVGRHLLDLAVTGRLPEITRVAAEALAGKKPCEAQLMDGEERAFVLRASPYVSEENRADGVVLAFLDVERARRKALEESSRLMSALTAIDLTINSALDVDEIMRAVVDEATRAIGADSAVLYRYDGHAWVASHFTGLDGEPADAVFLGGEYPFLEKGRHDELWFVRDSQTDERFAESTHRRQGDRSLLAIQLVMRGEVGGVLVFGFRRKVRLGPAALDFARRLGASVAVALENARLYSAQSNVADRLQRALLELPDHVAGIDFAANYLAAAHEASVGGDFYDVFEMGDDLVALVVGDVSGKGLDAAVLTALARNALRAHALEERDPAVAFEKLNRLLHRFTSTEMFLTAFFGILDVKNGALRYCSAGHPPAVIVRPHGAELLECGNPMLGATGSLDYEAGSATLGMRDTLLLYTDGITEARAGGGELFGTQRLLKVVETVSRSKPEELLGSLMEEVLMFAGGHLQDDVALLAVRRHRVRTAGKRAGAGGSQRFIGLAG